MLGPCFSIAVHTSFPGQAAIEFFFEAFQGEKYVSTYLAVPDAIERIMDSSHIQLHSYPNGQTIGATVVSKLFYFCLTFAHSRNPKCSQ